MKNTWDKNRKQSGWSGGFVSWVESDTAYISCVFSWQVQKAYQQAIWYRSQGLKVRVGGPAVSLHPSMFEGVAKIGGEIDALSRHNPNATFTTRGCIRNCKFCAVPKIEGKFRELETFPVKPIVCDNNFLASSKRHFDRVIDLLKPLEGVDFNQGLDARLLTDYHAERLAELSYRCIRLAWDHTRTESQFRQAFERLLKAGIPADYIHVYILIGFDDTPDDALYRLQTTKDLGAFTIPMRYQPLDSMRRTMSMFPPIGVT